MTAITAIPPVPPLFLPCYAPVPPLLRIDSVREKGSRKARGIEVLSVWGIQAVAFSPVFFPVSREAAERLARSVSGTPVIAVIVKPELYSPQGLGSPDEMC